VSKGFLIYAEGASYIEQAYALALSIQYSQMGIKSVSLMTQDTVPEEYQSVFHNIVPIPWYDAPGTDFSAEHRWKVYHATPYHETIVLDADMLLLEDISKWWEYLGNHEVRFCNRITNYKLESVVDTYHRKAFVANGLTSPYYALHYFKKTDFALEFYKSLEFVCKNWEWCWTKFAPEEYQNWLSMDLAVAVAIELSYTHDQVLDNTSPLEFIHMKTPLQGWERIDTRWQDSVLHVLNTNGDLVVGNIKQSKVFHYVEKDFITPKIIDRLTELAHGKS